MDEVKLLRERPHLLKIVNFNFTVGWDKGRLDLAEMGADDTGRGKLVSKVNRPDSCPCTKVKNILNAGRNWRMKELAVHVLEEKSRAACRGVPVPAQY
jgi:hypothetical protein